MKSIFIIITSACFFSFQLLCQGYWTRKADFGGAAKVFATGFSIGTKGYIGIGDTTNPTNDFWEWDQATNVWTQKADFGGAARANAVGFSIGSKGYIGTGSTGNGPYTFYNDFWEWDQFTNLWTQKANFGGTARGTAIGFSIGTKGYIGTGDYFNGSGWIFYNDFWEWDQSTNVWVSKTQFGGTARQTAVGFSIGSKGYIGTGWDNNSLRSDFWEWDQGTNVWTQKANFGGTGRADAVGFSIGNKGYIGTGADTTGGLTNDFWEWDQANNTWAQKANFGGVARGAAIGFSIGSKGYIGIGQKAPNINTRDFWEYCDTCATDVSELRNQISISIFPNPTSGVINFMMSQFENTQMKSIEIYNTQGEKIYEEKNSSNSQIPIDTKNFNSGIYFYKVTNNEIHQPVEGKFIVTKN